MALLNGDTAKGVMIGVGLVLTAPLLLAAVGGFGRPAARAAVKAGLLAYEKGMETAAELGELVEDLFAEAEAEIESERAATDTPPTETAAESSVAAKTPPESGTAA
ncbi:DUF5132 domain-containing protein [Thioalkalivibrio sp.]|uniref:DUF5132 domain-containing protein n=1 Tax=Thioalkalivibrio sp. TaxID=2093813 RepID=UPI003975FF1A